MEELRGYCSHIIFRNEENAYTVFVFQTEDEEITCTGIAPSLHEGESCLLEGERVTHAVYGDQFRVTGCQSVLPETVEAMQRYLSSGAIKGIGEALAGRIIKKFGKKTMDILDNEPERLAEVKGISQKKAREIAAQLTDKKDLRDAMIFLQGYGVSSAQALKIWNTYGMNLYGILKENPYRLAEDIYGIGFATADEIARKAGIRADSDFRIRSGILYVLSQAQAEGNSFLPAEELLARTARLLGLQQGEDLYMQPDFWEDGENAREAAAENSMQVQLENLGMERKLYMRTAPSELQVYPASAYRTEQQIARLITELDGYVPTNADVRKLDRKIQKVTQRAHIELDDLQFEAVKNAVTHSVLLITGGPGTGKTTTINTIIRYFISQDMEVMLAAPTGRAAKRMSEATGFEARTLHRMLGVRGIREEETAAAADVSGKNSFSEFEKGSDNPLEADVIIVDEMSMVDMHLFHALLKAVLPGTRLILVGDMDQLPSVGPGKVLQDLIASEAFCTIRLRKIFRQAAESDIVMNAHRILQGEMPLMNNQSRDFFFLERDRVPVIYKHMVQLVQQKLPGYVNCRPEEIQVLTPMRKGMLGVEKLNEALQSILNPPEDSKAEHVSHDTIFREGDKVMQTRNNYQIEWEIRGNFGIPIEKGSGIFNGDFGIIREIDADREMLTVVFDEERVVEYPFAELEDLELAYAITVHKSQGSEYPAVVMPLLSGPSGLFNRNLLYTAVTRAKNCVVILGADSAVRSMVENVRQNTRRTGLKDRILEMKGVNAS